MGIVREKKEIRTREAPSKGAPETSLKQAPAPGRIRGSFPTLPKVSGALEYTGRVRVLVSYLNLHLTLASSKENLSLLLFHLLYEWFWAYVNSTFGPLHRTKRKSSRE